MSVHSTNIRPRIIELESNLSELKASLEDLKDRKSFIKFSNAYLAYRIRSFWPVLDNLAIYSHMILYLTVVLLNIFWWFNVVNII